jgi:hypothetical protein
LIALKGKARQYKNHVEWMTDPRHRIFLHLQENQELSSRLENLLVAAITRLNTNIDVLEGFILTSKDIIKGLTLRERAIKAHYKNETIIKDKGKLHQHYNFYHRKSNRIKISDQTDSPEKASNHIKRIKNVIPYLDLSEEQTANEDLKLFKIAAKTHFNKDII